MPSALFQIGIDIVGRDKATQTFNKTAQGLKQLNQSAKNAEASFKNLAGAFTGLLVAGKIKDAIVGGFVKPAMELEDSLSRLKVLAGVSGKALDKFVSKSWKVARVTPFDRPEIVRGMEILTKATGSAETALNSIDTAAKLAVASFKDLDLKQATEMVGGISRAYGVEGKELYDTVNRVANAAKASGVYLSDLSGIMERLSMSQISANQSFDSLLNSFLLARRIFPSSLRAQTQLFRMYQELGKIDVQDKLLGLGVQTKDALGKILPAEAIFKQLFQRYSEFPDNFMEQIRGVFTGVSSKAVFSIMQAMEKGVPMGGKKLKGAAVFDMFAQMKAGGGDFIGDALKEAQKTTSFTLKTFMEGLKNIATAIGTQLLPILTNVGKILLSITDSITFMIKKVPFFKEVLTALFGAIFINLGVMAVRAAKSGIIRILSVVRYNLQSASKDAGVLNALLGRSVALSGAASVAGAAGARGIAAGRGAAAAGGAASTATGLAAGAGALAGTGMLAKAGRTLAKTRVGGAAIKAGAKVMGSKLLGPVVRIGGKVLGGLLTVFGGLPGLLLGAGIMFAGPIYKTVRKFWGGDKPQEKLKDAAKALSDSAIKQSEAADKELQAAKLRKEAILLSSKEYEKMLDKSMKLSSFEPAIVKWQKANKAMGVFGRAAKGGKLSPDDLARVKNMQFLMPQLQELGQKAMMGEATPEEHMRMTSMAASIFASMKWMQRKYKGVISEDLMKGVGEDWFQQLIKAGSAEGKDFASLVYSMGTGMSPTNLSKSPNWDTEKGTFIHGTPTVFDKYRPMFPRDRGLEQTRAYFDYQREQKLADKAERLQQSYQGQIRMDVASEEMLKLAKTTGLNVRVISSPGGDADRPDFNRWASSPMQSRVE